MNRSPERLTHAIAGLLLLAGTVAFLWGGAQHPATGESLGPIGSDEYFRNFVEHVRSHRGWEAIHTGILAGPVLWALGIAAWSRRRVRDSAAGLANVALAMGAALWAVTFVFDGFLAPVHAAAVPSAGEAALHAFRANQNVVIRLGLVSWLLIGAAVAALGARLLAQRRRRVGSTVLGVVGVALGLWPLVAWAAGVFRPGPFTSPAWIPTAVLTALWFAVLGTLLLAGRVGAARRLSSDRVPGSMAQERAPAYTRR